MSVQTWTSMTRWTSLRWPSWGLARAHLTRAKTATGSNSSPSRCWTTTTLPASPACSLGLRLNSSNTTILTFLGQTEQRLAVKTTIEQFETNLAFVSSLVRSNTDKISEKPLVRVDFQSPATSKHTRSTSRRTTSFWSLATSTASRRRFTQGSASGSASRPQC